MTPTLDRPRRSGRGTRFAMLSLLLGLAFSAAFAAPPMPTPRPNIVFVLLDDAGFSDFGAYGSEIQTPNIDQIAKTGVRFTNFHTASTCESSRAMLHTGIDHHRAGAGTLKVVMADNQKGKPGYEGYLSDKAHSLGQLLHDGGYATYFAGKWNLGDGVERSPGAKGWDRYLSLEQTGADNYEAKVYAPLNMEAVWWEDGKRARLPADFFSTRHYVDKMVQFIEEGKSANKPFFATIALQAVHSPLQAPEVDINKYKERYAAGWEAIRSERYQRQIKMGLVPAGLKLPQALQQRGWNSLSTQDQQLYAKKMAVFAGMLDNADQHIGRFRNYLKSTGQLDNTVFIIMSDNGADGYELNKLNLPFRLWYQANFTLGIESLGQQGSYVHYGQDWAEVSNTPFASFKGTSAEGGMRVPFIINYPQRIKPGGTTEQFAYATDFLPTVLDIAGIAAPGDDYQGKKLMRPTGVSMLPYLEGRAPAIHDATYSVGFEGTGADTLYRGDFKISRNGPPFGDNQWHLYNVRQDPTESQDLRTSQARLFQDMLAEYDVYLERNGVIKPPADYAPLQQLLKNNWPVLVRQMAGVLGAALALLVAMTIAVAMGVRHWVRRTTQEPAD
jgi:arylsulfatase A-like enzyme